MKYLHKVRKGDSLSSISSGYGVSAKDILDSNNITREGVQLGTILCINKIDGVRHVVKPFESIDKISSKYGITSEKIRQFNNILNVFVGEIIYIPHK